LQSAGVLCDFREPNVLRAAPAPLYNTFEEIWRFVQILAALP
jgi:kynureninase